MPEFERKKSKPRCTIPGRNLLPSKICSVFSNAFVSKTSRKPGFSSSDPVNQCTGMQMIKTSMNKELASDRGGEYRGGNSSFSGARGRTSKIARIKYKWNKNRKAKHDDNSKRSKPLASRFSALFRLTNKNTGFSFETRKISSVNKVGTNEDSFAGALTGYRESQSPDFNRKRATKDEEGLELCKKRILMGERCRALNSSGSLHYDHNGVLLPEFLPNE